MFGAKHLLEGGKPFNGKLAHPPSNTGAFQNLGVREAFGAPPEGPIPEFYADAAVVAFRVPQCGSGRKAAGEDYSERRRTGSRQC